MPNVPRILSRDSRGLEAELLPNGFVSNREPISLSPDDAKDDIVPEGDSKKKQGNEPEVAPPPPVLDSPDGIGKAIAEVTIEQRKKAWDAYVEEDARHKKEEALRKAVKEMHDKQAEAERVAKERQRFEDYSDEEARKKEEQKKKRGLKGLLGGLFKGDKK